MPTALELVVGESQWRRQVADALGGLPTKILSASKTYDPPLVAPLSASATTTLAVAGAAVGNRCMAGFSNDLQGLQLNAWVSAANTASANLLNLTGGAIDLASGTLSVDVWVP